MSDERLPPDAEAQYTDIIDDILKNADLNTISAKAIRKGLQAKVDHELAAQKKPITDLIMRRFDKFTEAAAAPPAPKPSEPTPPVTVKTETKANGNGNGNSTKEAIPKATNGTNNKRVKSESLSLSDAEEDDESQLSSLESSPPPKKKQKASRSTEDSDAAFAARLQAEENRARRATRGAATGKRKAAPAKKVKKERKKKSKARVGSDEDSDVEGGEKKEVKRNGGFHKPMTLSTPLSALLDGETTMSRPQTVKRIWAYIKENKLQDPNDGRHIICDDKLRAVFKTDKVHMFTMNKLLGQNLYAAGELANGDVDEEEGEEEEESALPN